VEDLAGRLSDAFETKVKIQIGRAKGRIVVEFGSVDDLQRIIGQMAPDVAGRRPEE
jgi:ParB family chromosome partitioning protein